MLFLLACTATSPPLMDSGAQEDSTAIEETGEAEEDPIGVVSFSFVFVAGTDQDRHLVRYEHGALTRLTEGNRALQHPIEDREGRILFAQEGAILRLAPETGK
jgi:hypothetical protein